MKIERFNESIKDSLENEFEIELSKYLTPFINVRQKLFLIDDDLGAMIDSRETYGLKGRLLNIITIYKPYGSKRWKSYEDYDSYSLKNVLKNESIEDFVKNYIKKLEKIRNKRNNEKKIREIRRTSKKYNL